MTQSTWLGFAIGFSIVLGAVVIDHFIKQRRERRRAWEEGMNALMFDVFNVDGPSMLEADMCDCSACRGESKLDPFGHVVFDPMDFEHWVTEPGVLTEDAYYELLGTDDRNPAAVTIWETLRQHGYKIKKKIPTMEEYLKAAPVIDLRGQSLYQHNINEAMEAIGNGPGDKVDLTIPCKCEKCQPTNLRPDNGANNV